MTKNSTLAVLLGICIGVNLMLLAMIIDSGRAGIKPFTEYDIIKQQRLQLQQKTAEQQVTTQAIHDLNDEINTLKTVIDRMYVVTATVYYPTGNEMRSGKHIPVNYRHATTHTKYIAISQDLWTKNGGPYSFGDSIRVIGTKYDAIYVIEDTMNKRHKNRIDILVERGKPATTWKCVKIYKV